MLAGKAASGWEAVVGVGGVWRREDVCADRNRCWFILEACWVTSTQHIPFVLTMAVKAGVARPSSGDRWSLLERGHSTVLSVRGVLLEPPRANTISFCWEHTGASVYETSIGSGSDI